MITVNVGAPIQADCKYKTVVLKGNLSFESQVADANTKYVVKWNFQLKQDVTISENCIIEFDGGSIDGSGHIMTGNDTLLIYNQSLEDVLFNVVLRGTWIQNKSDGVTPGVKRSGSVEERPNGNDVYVGFIYFATDLGNNGQPIFWNGVDWVDVTGAVIS